MSLLNLKGYFALFVFNSTAGIIFSEINVYSFDMDINSCLISEKYLDFEVKNFKKSYLRFFSLKGRLLCAAHLVQKLVALPFAITIKVFVSLFRASRLLLGFIVVMLSMGISRESRRVFFEQFSLFGRDVADLILLPAALSIFLVRHLLGIVLHPRFFYRIH